MAKGYTALPTSSLLGSVPAALDTDEDRTEFEEANLQIFPPSNSQGGTWGYQLPTDADGKERKDVDDEGQFAQSDPRGEGSSQSLIGWKGLFHIASYRPYFNIDAVDVVERIVGSLCPHRRDFFEKTRHNPDMYGPVWISTTLVFIAAAFGNYASYLSFKQREHKNHWIYDINYVNWAVCVIYGYICFVPIGFKFLLQYLGIPSSLVQLWCLFGYSLFIFIPASFLLIFPTELLRWVGIILAGLVSASFVALNVQSYIMAASDRWALPVACSFVLQICLAFVIKLCFFI